MGGKTPQKKEVKKKKTEVAGSKDTTAAPIKKPKKNYE